MLRNLEDVLKPYVKYRIDRPSYPKEQQDLEDKDRNAVALDEEEGDVAALDSFSDGEKKGREEDEFEEGKFQKHMKDEL